VKNRIQSQEKLEVSFDYVKMFSCIWYEKVKPPQNEFVHARKKPPLMAKA